MWEAHSNWGFGHAHPLSLPPKTFVVVDKSDFEDVFCHDPFYDHIPKLISHAAPRIHTNLARDEGGGVNFLLESGEGRVQRGSRRLR